jgi:glypican 5
LGNLDDSSCRTVAEVFAKRVQSADKVQVSLISDAALNECSDTLKHTNGFSCCSPSMETSFLHASADYLRDHVRTSNSKLKDRIIHSLDHYQEHLLLSMEEARNKTSETLSALYKIPKDVHNQVLDVFFDQLNQFLTGSNEQSLTDIISNFFLRLFPAVFDYVLSDPSRPKRTDENFHKCLMEHYHDIQPFGNAPTHLGTKIKYAFRRARIFTETLEVMVRTIDSADSVQVDRNCQRALSRLQFCSLCSGVVEAKPCRGMCLNVMRGCLAAISEISSSWDELVVAFENLHLGMFRHNNAQELLSYLDGNVTDALLQAMDDGPRIYSKVTSLCQDRQQTDDKNALYKKLISPEGYQPSHPSSRIHSIRRDISNLIAQLEDSKGFLLRIADGLCRNSSIYDQEMQSDRCWNGSAVGNYMHSVPEANMISQAQHNIEVRITLIPVTDLLRVKDTLAHMRRNLSVLHNEELMLKDESYKTVVGSGGGYSTQGRQVIIDDEDFAEGASASGSGDDPDHGEEADEEKSTVTARPTGDGGRGQGSTGTSSPGSGRGSISVSRPPVTDKTTKPKSPAASLSLSVVLAAICGVLSWVHAFL